MAENDYGADPEGSGVGNENPGENNPQKRTRRAGQRQTEGHSASVIETLSTTLSATEFTGYLKGNIIAATLSGNDDNGKSLMQYTKLLNEFLAKGKISSQKED